MQPLWMKPALPPLASIWFCFSLTYCLVLWVCAPPCPALKRPQPPAAWLTSAGSGIYIRGASYFRKIQWLIEVLSKKLRYCEGGYGVPVTCRSQFQVMLFVYVRPLLWDPPTSAATIFMIFLESLSDHDEHSCKVFLFSVSCFGKGAVEEL